MIPSYETLCKEVAKPPLVSCLMVTGRPREGAGLDRLPAWSLHSFLEQTYTPRELVIVNQGRPIDIPPLPNGVSAREVPTACSSLGFLRKVGVEAALGDWLCLWDDDDYSHPHRLAFQMAARRENHCVMLQWQIRFGLQEFQAVEAYDKVGHDGTLLFPKGGALYNVDLGAKDAVDSEFWTRAFRGRAIALDNNSSWYPGPALFVRTVHGQNAKPMEQLLGGCVGPEYQSRWQISENSAYFLAKSLRQLGWDVKSPRMEPPPASRQAPKVDYQSPATTDHSEKV